MLHFSRLFTRPVFIDLELTFKYCRTNIYRIRFLDSLLHDKILNRDFQLLHYFKTAFFTRLSTYSNNR